MVPAKDSNQQYVPTDFGKVQIGIKKLDDAILTLGDYRRINPRYGNKKQVLTIIAQGNINAMRDISNFFYRTSGIYKRLCRYMAYLYKYDWFITPYIENCEGLIDLNAGIGDVDSQQQIKNKRKIFNNFFKVLKYFQNFEVKKTFGEIALKVVRYGCYYGYLIPQNNTMNIQELPPAYCRSRFKVNKRPVIEFNMRYFDDFFPDQTQKSNILNMFPKEFKKGYRLYKLGKLTPGFVGDTAGWYTLDPNFTIKFK